MRKPLDFRFKGSRTYVHGTDMLNATVPAVLAELARPVLKNLSFVINRMTSANLELLTGSDIGGAGANEAAVAHIRFDVDGAKRQGVLRELSTSPSGRYEYDEDSIVALCRVDTVGRAIVLERPSSFTPIETLVAMTKALHLAVFADAGKWLFCRLDAPVWPPAGDLVGVSIRLDRGVGTRLTKSRIQRGDDLLGWIYFAARSTS